MIIYTELQLNIAHMKKHYSRAQAMWGLKAGDLWYTYFFQFSWKQPVRLGARLVSRSNKKMW